MTEDNWFEKAAKEAEASDRGVEAARRAAAVERAKEVERKIEERRRERIARSGPPRPAEAAAAAAMFEAVASGKASPLGTGPTISWTGPPIFSPGGSVGSMRPPGASGGYFPASGVPSPPTPEQGLEAILRAIRKAGDADAVLKAGGEWITKITNGISQVIRESEDES